MARPKRLRALFLAALACSGVLALAADTPARSMAVVTPMAPAVVCLRPQGDQAAALQDGRLRVAIVVQAFDVPRPASGRMMVSLMAGAPPVLRELGQFAIHPLRSFSAREPRLSQSYAFSLAGHAHLLEPGRPVCLRIAFDAREGLREGGRAELYAEWAT